MNRNPYLSWKVFVSLAVLAVIPYLRSLWLPAISDDHLQVLLSRQYGPVSGWGALLGDALYRSRATSLLMTHWTELLAGFSPFVFHLTSLAVHIVNTWLVLLLGAWSVVGWRAAAAGAAFFALYEGHQEAVIWYAALPELLVFTFGLGAFLCWTAWVESGYTRTWSLAAAFVSFVLAIYSKESGVLVVGLFVLPVLGRPKDRGRGLAGLAPFALAAAAYFASIYLARSGHQHFHDGTFSLDAPVIRNVAFSTARLFWFWGLLATGALAFRVVRGEGLNSWSKSGSAARLLVLSMLWIWIAFLPYSFLTYMKFVPSRHTYFASAGLALIVGTGALAAAERFSRPRLALALIALVAMAHNAGYVWTRKHAQYLERAAPIEAIIHAARASRTPLLVHCFPFPFPAAEAAVVVGAGKPADFVRPWAGDPKPGVLCLDPASHQRFPLGQVPVK